MDYSTMIHDVHGICEKRLARDFIKKFIDVAPDISLAHVYDYSKWPNYRVTVPKYESINFNKFSKYLTRTTGHLYVKMLAVIEQCGSASYHEIYKKLLKPRGTPFGHDTLLLKSLFQNGLVELDHVGRYKRKFYHLTALGKLVLDTARKNDIAYRVLRHFVKIDGCDFDQMMINIQLNPDTMDDVTPEAFVSMLDAVLNDKSCLHEVGSYAYWCNKLMECLKKSADFFELFNCQEVNDWLESSKSMPNVQRFISKLDKIRKNHAKKAAAA